MPIHSFHQPAAAVNTEYLQNVPMLMGILHQLEDCGFPSLGFFSTNSSILQLENQGTS